MRYYRGPRHGAINCLQRGRSASARMPRPPPEADKRGHPGSVGGDTPLTPTAPDIPVRGGSMLITIKAHSPAPAVPDSGAFAIPTVTATSSDRADDAVTRTRRKRAGYSMIARVAALRRIRHKRLQSVLVGLLKVMPVGPHSFGDKGEFTDMWSAAWSGDSEHRPVSRPVADPAAVRAFQRSVSSRSEGEQCTGYECSWSMTTKWCGEG